MRILVMGLMLLIGNFAFAGGLPGLKSGEYVGANKNGGECLLIVTRSRLEIFEYPAERRYRDFIRRRFEYDSANDYYVYPADEYNLEAIVYYGEDGKISDFIYNPGGFGGVNEIKCMGLFPKE